MKIIKEFNIGDEFSKTVLVTEKMINGFAEYSGDKNPVHLDAEYAKKTIFKKRIAHGFLVGSFISAALGNDFPGEGTIYLSQSMRFLSPVYINDEITVKLRIIDFPKDKWIQIKTICCNQDEVDVIEGEAVVMPPKNSILNN